MIVPVVKIGNVELCCYPRNGWAVFVYRDNEWKCVRNGKFNDVFSEFQRLTKPL